MRKSATKQAADAAQRLAKNVAANEAFVKKEYPGEKFVSKIPKSKRSRWTKNLEISEGVKLAESRIPRNKNERNKLYNELEIARILSHTGNSTYLTPEPGKYKEQVFDGVVNGIPFEFRTLFGSANRLSHSFGEAKRKGDDVNVIINIKSNISKKIVRQHINGVLGRHPHYTGKIVISFDGRSTYFWDTKDFR